MKGLKERRLALKLSVKELSEKLKVSVQAVYYYENGLRFPREQILKEIAYLLDCTIDEIF